ncbi:hypothetical protein P691DRAFT_784570, partial [Macrolepiota fuliginosa MF-IS2]
MSQSYNKEVTQTLMDISSVLKEGAELLGTSIPGAGITHHDFESMDEQWGDHSGGHTHLSTSHLEGVVGGKRTISISGHSACEGTVSPVVSHHSNGLSTLEVRVGYTSPVKDKSLLQGDIGDIGDE